MIEQAVILAAGNGSRIQRFKADVPKPLRKVAGLTLIKRSILTARRAGVKEFVIVVGYKGEQIVRALEHDPSLGVSLRFVFNADYEKSNGVSLLAAQPFVSGNFLLMMADHVFDPKAVRKMVNEPVGDEEVLLGVDKKLDQVFDLDDVTKVQAEGDHLSRIGKDLTGYNAFDTGIFICSPAIFGALQRAYEPGGDVSLTQGVLSLAQDRRVRVCDLSDYFWQDVDTPEALKHAEKMLFNSVKKSTDGFVSRHLNRRISIPLSRLFIKMGLSANQVTFFVTAVGLLSGYFIASGRYWEVAIGGLLFQFASILDGCDGEIAKLKLSASRYGEWLDTISDNLTYLVFLIGVSMGAHRQLHGRFEVIEAAVMFVGVGILFSLLIWYLLYYANSGSLIALQKDLNEEDRKQGSQGAFSWTSKIRFLMKRDFFAFFFMLLCFADQLPLILHLSFVGINMTWIVILSYKKDLFRPGISKVKVAGPR